MTRLIDADALENEIITDLEHTDIADYWIDYVVAITKSAPTIDITDTEKCRKCQETRRGRGRSGWWR